jgi:acetate kinase
MKILVLNSGSSSQKACLYEIGETLPDDPPEALWEGKVEFGNDTAAVVAKNSRGAIRKEEVQGSSRKQVLRHLLNALTSGNASSLASINEIKAVGHRVVHGGPNLSAPIVVTPDVRSAIADATALAPLHIPSELEGMDVAEAIMGPVPQVAVFDTGFHSKMPASAAIYPGPYEWFESGIHRYGFHGINHQYCATRAANLLNRELQSLRTVVCHLGNGCSVTAVDRGRSVDTTMGFTPLDGLAMGTRSGGIDPGILIHLMRRDHLDSEAMDHLLNKESGLLGISGLSSDMREILAAMRRGHRRATLAFDIFVHRLRSAIGRMAAVLGGMDALVFTAGVGENSSDVRTAACSTFGFMGLKLDEDLNAHPVIDQEISSADSKVRVLVIRAQEDWAIASECWKLTRTNTPVGTAG